MKSRILIVDDEASVRANLDRIRHQVGVVNAMPFTPPNPPCTERARIVRWIDADASPVRAVLRALAGR